MYPSQTSLIPVTVALIRFVETNGIGAYFSWHPHWYLGTPFKYLVGPVVPGVIALLKNVFTNVPLFGITIYIVIVSYAISVLGWVLLFGKLQDYTSARKTRLLSYSVLAILLVVLPWRMFSSLTLAEGTLVVARNLLPFALLSAWSYLATPTKGTYVAAAAMGTVLLLTNTSVNPIYIVGLAALVIAKSYKKGKLRGTTSLVKKGVLLVLAVLMVSTLWYGFGYWLTILTNPSIGGESGLRVILRIFDLLKAGVPVVLAVLVVYFSHKFQTSRGIFIGVFVATFVFLTVFRFLADVDYWQDWTSWFYEIEVGLSFFVAHRIGFSDRNLSTRAALVLIMLLPFYFTWRINLALGRPQLIGSSVPSGVQSLAVLNEIVAKDRVFLSGSTVFWVNSLYDLNQLRGGRDGVSVHPLWHHAAYQLREGGDPELSRAWLEALGISYVLVHGPRSKEVYHDFRHIEKWQDVGKLVWQGDGDMIFEIDANLAWSVDGSAISGTRIPEKGDDMAALHSYLAARLDPLDIEMVNSGYLINSPRETNTVQVAVAYDHNWRAYNESGQSLSIEKDPMGNLMIHSNGASKLVLTWGSHSVK